MCLTEQEKITILTNGFKVLNECQKGYIAALLRKLVDIHCNAGNEAIPVQKDDISFPFSDYSKGVFV